jgi:hypothetical protein
MRKSKFSETQTFGILKDAVSGVSVAPTLCRQRFGLTTFVVQRPGQAVRGRDHRPALLMIPANFRFHIFANPVGDATPKGVRF